MRPAFGVVRRADADYESGIGGPLYGAGRPAFRADVLAVDGRFQMKVLRADGYATVPWRNGGGTTREIAVYRDQRRHEDFLWRLSVATVAQPGPFSRFEGVDRTIALIDGEGMTVRSAVQSATLIPGAPPFSFDGGTKFDCELLGGPTVDLNAMTRRGFFTHALRREEFVGRMTFQGAAERTFLVVGWSSGLSLGNRDSLHPLDTVADIDQGASLELHSDRPAEIFIVELAAA